MSRQKVGVRTCRVASDDLTDSKDDLEREFLVSVDVK